ncbi:hypothetical protein [Glutamicibacter sp. NPDC090743]|uniref:hypothetical protein n=1 Tax=Glutamicibacter sp. NPDC090743 TaxID=3364001 RepID=UPI00382658B5
MSSNQQNRITELENRLSASQTQGEAKQIVINNLRQWLSDTQLQLAEAVANCQLKDQLIQQLQNTEDSTE